MSVSIQQVLQEAETSLTKSDSPRLDAELLLSHYLKQPRTYLFANAPEALSESQLAEFQNYLQRRIDGEPIAYIVGMREFWDIELVVNPSVLVPRPETELLVEAALELFAESSLVRIADLGTGSGAIALAIGHSKPGWQIDAVDISEAALATATANARRLDLCNVEFSCASWCDGLEQQTYDLIIANPPYVAPGDAHLQQGDLRFEPNSALEAAENGLADLYSIAEQARNALKTNGYLLMEHGFDQHQVLDQRLNDLGYADVNGRNDLAGHCRMIQARWTGELQQ